MALYRVFGAFGIEFGVAKLHFDPVRCCGSRHVLAPKKQMLSCAIDYDSIR
jgi:hypothetical protein